VDLINTRKITIWTKAGFCEHKWNFKYHKRRAIFAYKLRVVELCGYELLDFI